MFRSSSRLRFRGVALAVAVLVVPTMLAASMLALPFPARADEPIVRDHRDPVARVEIVIKKITIHDDRDWGQGDMTFHVEVTSVRDGTSGDGCCADVLRSADMNFGAHDREVVELNRVVPAVGDLVSDATSGPGMGIAIRTGMRYKVQIRGKERDPIIDDELGEVSRAISVENGLGPLGTYTERGDKTVNCEYLPPHCPFYEFEPANFTVEYEIRRTALPDLVAHNFRVFQPSQIQMYCVIMLNTGQRPAGAFGFTIEADRRYVRDMNVAQLGAGANLEYCVQRSELPAEEHTLTFQVDPRSRVAEMDEFNNTITMRVPALQASVADPPPPSPSPARADLTVSAIRVRGQVPDGKDDCEDGKNDVSVVVKNGGAARAEGFVVRLVVDDDQGEAEEQAVSGLDAGAEHDVRFDDVRLKEGRRTIMATADAKKTVAETNEDNNERKVTVSCTDD